MRTKKIPSRICVGCREAKDKPSMVRIVKDHENKLFLDATGKKNGRGAYLCRNRECFERAVKNKGLERSLKIQIPKEVIDELEKEMSAFETG